MISISSLVLHEAVSNTKAGERPERPLTNTWDGAMFSIFSREAFHFRLATTLSTEQRNPPTIDQLMPSRFQDLR